MTTEPVISWSSQLATGLDDVDSQHKQLIHIINELGRMHANGATPDQLRSVFVELHDYTVYHFQHEAWLMSQWPVNEANKAAHLKAHRLFVERIEKAGELVATHPDAVVDHMLAFLVKWLVHHITGMDARLAREIMALRAGVPSGQASMENSALHDALVNTVSDLYDSLGTRTFEMVELNRQLQDYRNSQEEEHALTQDIISRLVEREGLSSAQLHYWFAPAAVFSGDIVAAVRRPDGRLYALLADATGHGLAAAVSALPVLTLFYALAERDCALQEILMEINRNLRETLPTGRFVAAAMICLDNATGQAQVWNGGMPPLLVLGPDGSVIKTMESSQLPLGIIDIDADMAAALQVNIETGCQLAMYSDGLVEAANADGEPFGVDRLSGTLQAARPDQRMAAVQQAVASHVGTAVAHDDISLMLIDCLGG